MLKKLETWKSFVTSDCCNVLIPPHSICQGFYPIQHSCLAFSEVKMVGSELVDLAETVGTSRKPTKALEFHHRSPSFF